MKKLFLILLIFALVGCARLQLNDPDDPFVKRSELNAQLDRKDFVKRDDVIALIKKHGEQSPGLQFLLETMESSEAYYIRAFTGHSGGATGDMDTVSCSALNDFDLGLVFDVSEDSIYFYEYDNDGTLAEDTVHYSVIRPDNYATCSQGNWLLFDSMNFAPSSLPAITFYDSDGLGADKYAARIRANMETLTDGLEDADICVWVIQGGSDTSVLCFDESDDRWEIPTTKGLAFGTTQWDNGSDSIDKDAIESIVVSAVWNAGGLSADGTQCADPVEVTLNSGPKQYTISCAVNSASIVYGHMIMPDSWDGNAVSLEMFVFHGTTESITFAGDFSAQCHAAGETVSSSWGSAVAADVSITTANQVESATASSITPAGTCAGGDMLWWRWVMDSGTSSANAANTDILGVKLEYTTIIGD